MAHRLRVSLRKTATMTMRRIALDHERLVYVICADKKLKYSSGYSQIAYIGTTRNGISRVAPSAGYRAWDVLWSRRVQSFDVRLVTCRPRQRIRSWLNPGISRKVRRASDVQRAGAEDELTNEFDVFSRGRLNQILEDLSERGALAERTAIQDMLAEGEENE